MLENIYNWWFWILIVIVFFVILYIYIHWTGNGLITKTSDKTLNNTSKRSNNRKTTRGFGKSRRIEQPIIESLDSDDSEAEYEDSTKLITTVPYIPSEILSEPPARVKKMSKKEVICKDVMEKIYGVPFQVNVRPDFLLNVEKKNGRNLELDISELKKLKIAVEIQGEGHYHYIPFFHKNGPQDFYDQQKRDRLKRRLCQENGIYLIEVPYTCPNDKVEAYIRYHLPEAVMARKNAELFKK